jgi:hypothetical protein
MANPTVRSWVEAKHFKDAEDWLRETHSQPMPDVVVSVPQIFDDYRTGDMIIVTVKDKQFKEDKLYGHGSLHAEDRRVVLLWHGPDINPGIYRYARIVDLYPTILALFGLKTAQPLDGVVRSEIFQEKFNTIAQTEIEKNPGMDAPTFRNFLEEKRNDPELSKLERQRAEQLLFDLRQFLAAQETEQKQQLAEVE